MIVMKFGGTSLGNADPIRNAANIVKSKINDQPVVVVSAVKKVTDILIELADGTNQTKRLDSLNKIKNIHNNILEELGIDKSLLNNDYGELDALVNEIKNGVKIGIKTLEKIQSFGERMSSKIVAAQLNKIGVNSRAFNSWDIGFLTDDAFGNAEPLETSNSNIRKNIEKLDLVPVVTGFIGKTEQGDITTLGRGGSDYTAAIIGASINADEIQIWTDVNGIMSADPRIVANAKTLDKVSFTEASELAYFGAKVLHPKTILPAIEKDIAVKVLNSFNPENTGTTILNESYRDSGITKAIAYKKNITLIIIESTRMLWAIGFLAKLFEVFNKYRKSVDVVSTSEVSVSLTIDNEDNIEPILEELKEIADTTVMKNKSIICVVGEGMRNTPGIAGKTFTALSKNNINVEMISHGASGINITFIVDDKYAESTVKILHNEYFGC